MIKISPKSTSISYTLFSGLYVQHSMRSCKCIKAPDHKQEVGILRAAAETREKRTAETARNLGVANRTSDTSMNYEPLRFEIMSVVLLLKRV